MALTTVVKRGLGAALSPFNLRLDTLTAERAELARLRALHRKGYFDEPVFPLLPQFERFDPKPILAQVQHDASRFAEICAGRNDVGFELANGYFSTPDAEVLYALVQLNKPAQIVEIGSGNTTRLFRQAINDAALPTKLTSIDPSPRVDITGHSDVVLRQRLESLDSWSLFERLAPGDILFIDSSHEANAGNDVLAIFFQVLPRLRPGVLIHFHDIFLPYEYPAHWLIAHRLHWTEQYLMQALLTGNEGYNVIWPGYYLQRTLPGFTTAFAAWRDSTAQSLWLRKR